MSQKYKFRKGKTNLPEEELNKYKNFSDLLNTYQNLHQYKKATQPLYRNKKFMGLVLLLLIVLLAIILS